MKPNIGIAEKNLKKVTKLLSSTLSSENALCIKTRKFQLNVSGQDYIEFRKLFQEHYETLDTVIDKITKRISKQGPHSTKEEFILYSKLLEKNERYPDSNDMIKELLRDHETCIINIRKNIIDCMEKYEDIGTAYFFIGMMREHLTLSWQLRTYLKYSFIK